MIPKYRNANEYRIQTKYRNAKLQNSQEKKDDDMMMMMSTTTMMMLKLN